MKNIKIENVGPSQFPDFVDAYVSYAEYEDGTPLTEDELNGLEAWDYIDMQELAGNWIDQAQGDAL